LRENIEKGLYRTKLKGRVSYNGLHQTKRFNMSIETMQYEDCGSFNEEGTLDNLCWKGFTHSQSVSEILANSSDFKANEVRIEIIQNESIKLIDNGNGMDMQSVKKMYDMNRSNHKCDRSKGVAGMGGKAGQVVGGNKTPVNMYTHKVDGEYIHTYIPWNTIYIEGVFTNKIISRNMTEEEIQQFKNERSNQRVDGIDDSYHGTTIVFQYNRQLCNAIKCGIDKDVDRDGTAADQTTLFGFVFGRDDMKISLSYPDRPDKPIQYCDKYDYFGGNDDSYYCGKGTTTITHWQKRLNDEYIQSRFTYKKTDDADTDTLTEYPIKTTGYGKENRSIIVEDIENDGFEIVGTFEFECGLRIDNDHFNPDSPKELTNTEYVGPYDSKRLLGKKGEIYKHVGYNSAFVRNGQILGSFQYPDLQPSIYRASMENRHSSYVHASLSYEQISTKNNPNDKMAGIQENKNQWNTVLPTGLTRICRTLRDEKAKEIWRYKNGLLQPTIEVGAASVEEPENMGVTESTEEITVPSAIDALLEYTSDDDDATSSNANASSGGESDESGNTSDERRNSSSDSEPNAIDVISHRRGKVTKDELSEMLLKFNEKIMTEPNEFYIDDGSLKIFNLISSKINAP
jgi:hypothetical protein